jgi:3-hydroxyisobutyrate dehydrogenase
MHSQPSRRVAFAGLGAMGFGMASHLVKTSYHVAGFDVYEPSLTKFQEAGGQISRSPQEAAEEAEFFICMVANSQQVDSVLFDPKNGAAKGKQSKYYIYTLQIWN